MIVVAGGEPLAVLASTRRRLPPSPLSALPPALRDRLLVASSTKKQDCWTDDTADTFGLASPLRRAGRLGPRNGVAVVVVDNAP